MRPHRLLAPARCASRLGPSSTAVAAALHVLGRDVLAGPAEDDGASGGLPTLGDLLRTLDTGTPLGTGAVLAFVGALAISGTGTLLALRLWSGRSRGRRDRGSSGGADDSAGDLAPDR
ncbi:hypothetical protein [Cellulomonas triticagri]|uniref:Uncharacterized protein n=1 Tax=Cellulomonas triticagri TaxID=2483352 RepID=A0A3M2JNZ5_9CELL|nr:hypothetical protein [Cellulomonas triticagri]RMI13570.1 hypothetical protein EBM89_03945 [Cellulomonas triticagri]